MNKKQANAIDRLVGERVRARRAELGMSQEVLARKLGLSFQQIQKYEKGTNRISAGRLFVIAQALGTPVSRFFEQVIEAVQRNPGFAEEAAPSPVTSFFSSREGQDLANALLQIKDAKARKNLISLAKNLAAKEKDAAPAG
ncbi:MAG TPA: helix-turn-helix transcriptional regulator [Rhizomicrobium sp.]|nr:helix-turn-helix transcriptional regulator [Rhizomicrobium sp.]